MVQETAIEEFIFLVQTRSKELKDLLSYSIKDDRIRMSFVEDSAKLHDLENKSKIIAFIIGSDVPDPIQSAQRLHTYNKNAKILLLAKPLDEEKLKNTIRYSPFIRSDVSCLNITEESIVQDELQKLVDDTLQSHKHRQIIEQSNKWLTDKKTAPPNILNQSFINKLLDIAPIGIAIVDNKGSIYGWNREAAIIFSRNESEVLGKLFSSYFPDDEAIKIESFLEYSHDQDNLKQKDPMILKRKLTDESHQVLSITAAPFSHTIHNEAAFILAIQDITQQKNAEEELHKMNNTLEDKVAKRTASLLAYQTQLRSLASQLSKAEEKERQHLAAELHDHLGQMLAVLKMKVALLQRNVFSEAVEEEINEVKKGVEDALVYTRDLMSDLKPPPTLDKEDILESMKWLAKKMEKHGLKVHVEDDENHKPVSEDIKILLIQCVRELLFNIIKHSGVNEAAIQLRKKGYFAEITVSDNGVGFEPESLRSDSNISGFGLFNINERVDLMGGTVDILSTPGKGTEVAIKLPLKVKVEQPNETPAKVKDEANRYTRNKKKVRVLLVDDHKMLRDGLRKIVNEQKDLIVVAEAANGMEALKAAEETNPDVVVMDVNMPVMDGISATQYLTNRMPNTRVIALSFHDHQSVVDSMRSAGATAYITKNEAFETLCATIRSEANSAFEN